MYDATHQTVEPLGDRRVRARSFYLALTEELRGRKMRSLEKGHPLLEASGLEVLVLDRGLARVRMPIAINANELMPGGAN